MDLRDMNKVVLDFYIADILVYIHNYILPEIDTPTYIVHSYS